MSCMYRLKRVGESYVNIFILCNFHRFLKFSLPLMLPLLFTHLFMKFKSGCFSCVRIESIFDGFRAMLVLPVMNVLTHWLILLLY